MENNLSIGEERFQYWWNKKFAPNKSQKCKKIKTKLEENGHTNVFVWYETIGTAAEMGGNSGGYMYVSDQSQIEPIGYSFEEAMEVINGDWHKVIN
jgi:hypothetical protein